MKYSIVISLFPSKPVFDRQHYIIRKTINYGIIQALFYIIFA